MYSIVDVAGQGGKGKASSEGSFSDHKQENNAGVQKKCRHDPTPNVSQVSQDVPAVGFYRIRAVSLDPVAVTCMVSNAY